MQMTPEQFCYWLQGRAELQPDTAPTEAEWKMVREHLQTVFVKVTPQIGVQVKDGPDHQIRPTPGAPTHWWPGTLVSPPNTTTGLPIAIC
jgi:hypothetical protein